MTCTIMHASLNVCFTYITNSNIPQIFIYCVIIIYCILSCSAIFVYIATLTTLFIASEGEPKFLPQERISLSKLFWWRPATRSKPVNKNKFTVHFHECWRSVISYLKFKNSIDLCIYSFLFMPPYRKIGGI